MSDAIIMLSDRRVRLAGQSKHLGVRMRGRDDHFHVIPRGSTHAACMTPREHTRSTSADILPGGAFFFQRENRWCPWARWAQ